MSTRVHFTITFSANVPDNDNTQFIDEYLALGDAISIGMKETHVHFSRYGFTPENVKVRKTTVRKTTEKLPKTLPPNQQ